MKKHKQTVFFFAAPLYKRLFYTILVTVLLLSSSTSITFAQKADSTNQKIANAIALAIGVNGKIDPTVAYQTLLGYANQGYPMAMNAVGRLTFEGTGCPVDTKAGIEWLNKAGDAGYYSAWHNLGTIYKYGRSGVKQDFEITYYYFEKLAQIETDPSRVLGLYDAGYMLYKGLGCTQNYQKAFGYFKKGAELNFAPCMYMLALCYRNGYGVERTTGDANFWLSQAIQAGYSPAIDEYYSDGPENVPLHMKVSTVQVNKVTQSGNGSVADDNSNMTTINTANSKRILRAPAEFTRIPHIQNVLTSALDGEYEGLLVTYDWSGKVVVKETALTMSIKTDNKAIVAEWCEQGADTVQVKGTWTDSSLVFTDAFQHRKGHYDVKGKTLWTFTDAQLQILSDDSSSYLTGNLQMYSPETMEPNQPVYLSLRKTTKVVASPMLDQGFSAYPNPFEEGLNISFNQKKESIVRVAVYKIDGQQVYNATLGSYPEGQQNLTLTLRLDPGAYVLKLFTGEKVYQSVLIRK